MTLVAKSPHKYRGRMLAVGQHYEASRQDAKVLIYLRRAEYAPVVPSPPPVESWASTVIAVDLAEPDTRPKRRYRRRDLEAEE